MNTNNTSNKAEHIHSTCEKCNPKCCFPDCKEKIEQPQEWQDRFILRLEYVDVPKKYHKGLIDFISKTLLLEKQKWEEEQQLEWAKNNILDIGIGIGIKSYKQRIKDKLEEEQEKLINALGTEKGQFIKFSRVLKLLEDKDE